ncbi:MAG: molybdopterin-dependent oxidoreductase, partial [Planctomycetes bacterium]|nr:molybdopterin-dependent oxidoreductase [Planctomycetota bacterium]
HTDGGEAFRRHVRSTSWEAIERGSGVSRDDIERVAGIYAASQACVFAWTMGITHHTHGADNVRAIANLALLRGMVGRPHAGLLPIRGHSNVQGIGSVGVTPKLKHAIFERLESHFGVKLPTSPGMDTLACMEAMSRGELRNAWCLGGNLLGSNPDTRSAVEAFSRLNSVTYFSTTLNTGHAWGRAGHTLVLPVRPRDEESQATTQESMFSFVRISDGGPPRHYGPRSEVELVAHIASEVLGSDGPINWDAMKAHGNIRAAIAAVVPGYAAIADVDESRREFQIAGRTLHEPKFKTSSGRAQFHITPLPAKNLADNELRLMTIRSEGQFNTVVYEEHDLYRNQDRRDIILISEADMARLGLRAEQRITVRSATGEMSGILVRPFAIKPGNVAMYFPEANVLVPRTADPESRTPAFKAVRVTLLSQSEALRSRPAD